MSLTSILKEIDRVNRKQVEVEKRYNRRSKGCPRQEDLQREEQEDQHIFGTSPTIQVTPIRRCSPCSIKPRAATLIIRDHVLLLILVLLSKIVALRRP